MDVFEAIRNRHSVGKVKDDPLPRETVERLLEAGNQAPNHFKVRPWRFIVLTGEARMKLGGVMAASQAERHPQLARENLEKTRSLPLRSPLIIAVGVDKPADSKVLEVENLSAASAACQNILLATHALGLGAIWRTGEWARDNKVKNFLGLLDDQLIAGFLYIGYPEVEGEAPARPAVADRTSWMD
jgi:nitroreductase